MMRLVQQGHLNCFIQHSSKGGREAAQVEKAERGRRGSRREIARPEEVRRERSRSRPTASIWHRDTIATISGGGGIFSEEAASRRHEVQAVLTGANQTPLGAKRGTNPIITFDNRDLKHGVPSHDEPMVIYMIATEYRIERVLMDQGKSANIIYWSTFQKMKLLPSRLTDCSRTLYGFAGEQVPIKGTVELETVYGDRSGVKAIPVLYPFPVDQRIGSVWADSHVARRCYEDSLRVGSHPSKATKSTVNVLDLDLDLRCQYEHEGSHPAEDLKEIQLGPLAVHKTRIGRTLSPKEEARLVSFLRQNNDVFAWNTEDMSSIDPEFMCHRLSVAQGAKLITQKKRKQGEEKRSVSS
ncbi:hypothetical protein CR513_03994, partial [Mucuna pruriens]